MFSKATFSLLAALLLCVTYTATAQGYRWGNVAIGGGGFVSAIVPSRTQQNLFYARTDVGGAYRWDHAAASWVPLLDMLSEDNVGLMGVESLALDPKNSAVVYLLTGTSYFSNGKTVVMRSTDYGATFSQQTDVSALFRAHGNGMGRQNGERLQVDPGSSNVLYVGSRGNGLFKSTNGGASFARVNALNVTTTPNEAGISFVLLDPTSVANGAAQRMFVGVSRFGSVGPNLYRSDNAGASFTAVQGAPADVMPQRAALAADGNLYITWANGAGPSGHYRTLNPAEPMNLGRITKYNVSTGGWSNVTPAGYTTPFSGISVDPANAQRLVVSTINTYWRQGNAWGDQFLVTTNGGGSWTNVVSRGYALDSNGVSWVSDQSIHWSGSIEFDPFNARAVWVTSGNGVFRTANIDATPATWTFTVKGLEETVPLNLVSVPSGPLLTTIGDYDGFRHTDIDAYGPIHTPRMGTTSGLAVASANTAIVVRSGGEMYHSTNTGSSWLKVAKTAGTGGQVALSANGSSLLHTFTAGSATATYRSTNFSTSSPTWTQVAGLSGNGVRPVADPVNSNKFYAYDNGTLRVSTNGGANFMAAGVLAGGGSTLIRVAPGREGDLWVPLYGNGLARSTNSGVTFSTLAKVNYATAVGFGKAATGASYPTVFIWGAANGGPRGIYRSTDAGANWTRINDDAHQYGGPGNGQFVQGDMNQEGVVYMSTVGRGVVYGAPVAALPSVPTRLMARHSSRCIDVPGFSGGQGTALTQYTCNAGNNQQWALEPLSTGGYRIKVSHSGMCMDLASSSSANGVAVTQAVCGTSTSQQWLKDDMGNGWYRLRSRYSDRCVDVSARRLEDNSPLIQYTCGAGTNQQWMNH